MTPTDRLTESTRQVCEANRLRLAMLEDTERRGIQLDADTVHALLLDAYRQLNALQELTTLALNAADAAATQREQICCFARKLSLRLDAICARLDDLEGRAS